MGTQPASSLATHHLRSRIGRICVSISARNPAEMLATATEVVRETPFIEFRLDSLDKPQLITNKLKQFLSDHPLVTVVATCRRKANGGEFEGSVSDQMEHLSQAAQAGCQIVDVELETAESLKKDALGKLREYGAVVMVSFHDFKATPDLEAVYARMKKQAPDFYKIVPTAKTLADNLKVLTLLEKHAEDASMVGMAMGTCGIPSRLLGPRFGSLFTFASVQQGEETAPGQIAARTMTELYRVETIEPSTRVYGVAGSPVGASLSPLMLNTAFRRETVNAVYLALETGNVKDLLNMVEKLPVHGISITMPLKEQVLPHLEKTDPLSAKIGACNTLVRAQDGKLYGFNTDVGGIVGPLERRLQLRGAKILVLGAGGAARAAVFGLKDKGADVSILNRTPEKAQKLARQAGAKVMRRDQMSRTRFDVIINATPFGMAGNKSASPIAANELNCGLFFDLVYNPLETPLIRLARQKNIPIILGVEMFVQQGARQFEIWTGKPAPQDEMLRVVLHALRQQAESAPPSVSPPIPEGTPLPPEKPVAKPTPAPAPPETVPAKPVAPVAKAAPLPVKTPTPVKAAAAPAKKAAPVAAKVVAKKPAVPVKKAVSAPTKKTAAVKAVKKSVPAKKTASTKKAAPAKKPALTKKTAQIKKKIVPAKKVAPAKKATPKKPIKKTAPVKKATKRR